MMFGAPTISTKIEGVNYSKVIYLVCFGHDLGIRRMHSREQIILKRKYFLLR